MLYQPMKESGYPNVEKCMKNSRFACVTANITTHPWKYVKNMNYACGGLRLMEERLSYPTGV